MIKCYYSLLILLIGILIISCNPSENPVFEEVEIYLTASNFEISIDEGPTNQQILGVVEASTNEGQLNFSISEQNPENAFSINENSGELRVENAGLFNYETYPVLSGIVDVTNGINSTSVTITINLLDIQENDLLLKNINSTVNFPWYDISDQRNSINYVNGEINTWSYGYHTTSHTISFITNNSLITYFNHRIQEDTGACDFQYYISYDNSNRISNINIVDIYDCAFLNFNYNFEYNGDIVNLIDQIDTNHKSLILNSSNQILKYISGGYSIDFVYDGENLISKTDNSRLITYEYDNYRNPFKLNETLNLSQILDFINAMRADMLNSNRGNNIFNNTNNITRLVRSNIPSPIDLMYHYNYNSDDYPINKTMNASEGILEYYYE